MTSRQFKVILPLVCAIFLFAASIHTLCNLCLLNEGTLAALRVDMEAQVALISFLTIALLLVTDFFCYHLWLMLSGTTSYESYKWTLLYKRLKAEQDAEGSTASRTEAAEQSSLSSSVGWLLGGSTLQGVPANAYDWGMRRNLQDALMPPAWAASGGLLGSRNKEL